MILALVPEPDLTMWHEAASQLKSRGMVQVKHLGYQGSLLTEADVVFADIRKSTPQSLPNTELLQSLRFWAVLGDLAPFAGEDFESFSTSFDTERFGGQTISHLQIHGGSIEGFEVPQLLATTGPGAFSEDPNHFVIWPIEPFMGLGTRVSRDEPSVIQFMYKAVQGQGSLWVKPGLPFLIPDKPLSFRALDGSTVSGILCTSVDKAGGWVVLERQDILRLLGHSGDASWVDLRSIIGLRPAAALLGWLCAVYAGLPSRSVSAE